MNGSTLYIIAYDISNDKRRTKVHKILSGFGEWTQYSLFECYLEGRDLVKLRARLDDVLEPSEDSVRLYRLCAACIERVETVGSKLPEEKVTYLV